MKTSVNDTHNPAHQPAHPGEILQEDVLKPLGLTVTAAANHLGISRKTLSKILNQRGAVTPEMAVRLQGVFSKPSAAHWLRLQNAYDLWQVQQIGVEVSPLAA